MSKLRLGSRTPLSRAVLSINDPVPDFGGIFVSDTAERTIDSPDFWSQIHCLTDAVIDIAGSNIAVQGANLSNVATAVAIKQNTVLRGVFNRFKLASGTVVAYKGTD